jgi:hypothetical protein
MSRRHLTKEEDPLDKIYIVDEIMVRPGDADALHGRYMAEYAPGARARGMVLEHSSIAPPAPLSDKEPASLSYVWAVEGLPGFWQQRRMAGFDPAVIGWWKSIAPLVAERKRTIRKELAADV